MVDLGRNISRLCSSVLKKTYPTVMAPTILLSPQAILPKHTEAASTRGQNRSSSMLPHPLPKTMRGSCIPRHFGNFKERASSFQLERVRCFVQGSLIPSRLQRSQVESHTE